MKDAGFEKNNVDVLDILKDIFENINQWLVFAETKNGVLISLNGLLLFKVVDSFKDFRINVSNLKLSFFQFFILSLLILIFVVAIFLILGSFFPNETVLEEEGVNKCDTENPGVLIFYGDISKYKSSRQYLKDIYKFYSEFDIGKYDLNKYELDYAEEIIINSKIASYKYKCFKNALKLNGVGLLLLITYYILFCLVWG